MTRIDVGRSPEIRSALASLALLVVIAASGCASSPHHGNAVCRELIARPDLRDKLGVGLRRAIAKASESDAMKVEVTSSTTCPAIVSMDVRSSKAVKLGDVLESHSIEMAGDRIYLKNIYPDGSRPLRPALLNAICLAAFSPAVMKIDFEEGVSVSFDKVTAASNGDWMDVTHVRNVKPLEKSARIVASIDKGTAYTDHEDLPKGALMKRLKVTHLLDANGACPVGNCCSETSEPSNDHATQIAGTIAAMRDNNLGIDGLAKPSVFVSIDATSSEDCTLSHHIAAGISCALKEHASIVNLSFGDATQSSSDLESVLHQAAPNALVVVAAGNSSIDLDKFPRWPASDNGPTTITATTVDVVWDTLKLNARGANTVDIAVPIDSSEVQSTSNCSTHCYADYAGTTSAAAAIVSGTALSLWDRPKYRQCSAEQIRKLLMACARVPNDQYAHENISQSGGVLDFSFLESSAIAEPCECPSPHP